jgi:beta-mannanase
MLKPTTQESDGTSLQGYVDASYAELVAAFGEPNAGNDGYKTDAEWVLLDTDTLTLVTLYNYKDGRNYLRAQGKPVEAIRDWHIGGKSTKACASVAKVFPSRVRQGY